MPDFCQTMSSLEHVLKAYEQAGRILPSQYQCLSPSGDGQSLYDLCELWQRGVKRPGQAMKRNRSKRMSLRSYPGPRLRPGGARRSRTDDILLAKQALYQLSYGPIPTRNRLNLR